jgi:CheY-like chemotaxis protein
MRVLLVDDSALSRMMIRNLLLDKFPDCEVCDAGSGDAALEFPASPPFDLITIDINMPGMDSFEAAKLLHEKHPDSKMAVITANIQNSVRKKIQSLGIMFVAVIEKPITEERMEKVMRAL